mgnify:CR=1 FL=1
MSSPIVCRRIAPRLAAVRSKVAIVTVVLFSSASAHAQWGSLCPPGSTPVSAGGGMMCMCADGSYANYGQPCGGGGYQSSPQNVQYCPNGGTCALDQTCCGNWCCGAGSQCSRAGCIPLGAQACSSRQFCHAGYRCSHGGGCVPEDAVDCGRGSSCPAGHVCWTAPEDVGSIKRGEAKCPTSEGLRALEQQIADQRRARKEALELAAARKKQAEEERRAAERKRKEEAARVAAEAKRLKAEQERAERERVKRAEEERKATLKAQKELKLKQEQEKREAALRAEEERKKQAEEARQAALKAKELERQKAVEAKRQAEIEKKQREEEAKAAAARAKRAEEERIAEARRQADTKAQADANLKRAQSVTPPTTQNPAATGATITVTAPQYLAATGGRPSNPSQTTATSTPPNAGQTTSNQTAAISPPSTATAGNAAPSPSPAQSRYSFSPTSYGTVEVFQNGQRIATTTPQYAAQQYGYQTKVQANPQTSSPPITSGNVTTPSGAVINATTGQLISPPPKSASQTTTPPVPPAQTGVATLGGWKSVPSSTASPFASPASRATTSPTLQAPATPTGSAALPATARSTVPVPLSTAVGTTQAHSQFQIGSAVAGSAVVEAGKTYATDALATGLTPKLAGALVGLGQTSAASHLGLSALANPSTAVATAGVAGNIAPYIPDGIRLATIAKKDGLGLQFWHELSGDVAVSAASNATLYATGGNAYASALAAGATRGVLTFGDVVIAPRVGDWIFRMDEKYAIGITPYGGYTPPAVGQHR